MEVTRGGYMTPRPGPTALIHSLSHLSAMPLCPKYPIPTLTHILLAPMAYRVAEMLTLRSHYLVPGLTRTCLPILAKDSKFASKVKSELTCRLICVAMVLNVKHLYMLSAFKFS
jgi:hypothetical protein